MVEKVILNLHPAFAVTVRFHLDDQRSAGVLASVDETTLNRQYCGFATVTTFHFHNSLLGDCELPGIELRLDQVAD